MKRYIFCYTTFTTFEQPVINHAFLLRCLPVLGEYMNVEEEHLVISSELGIRRATDAWGNRIVYGGDRDPHSTLSYVSTGILAMEPYAISEGRIKPAVFLQSTPLTFVAEDKVEAELAKAFKDRQEGDFSISDKARAYAGLDVAEKAMCICNHVHGLLSYTPLSTTISTTASEVLASRKGVCQDYAHLMIALCQGAGIPARYACGFVEGEGLTHAWVEVFDGYRWIGFDPTHGRRIAYGYVKVAHGRDAASCPVSRGLYAGYTKETSSVNVALKRLDSGPESLSPGPSPAQPEGMLARARRRGE